MKTNILVALFGIFLAGSVVMGQSTFDTSPDGQTGEKPLGSYFSTDIDTVSMTNGNLHVNIPVFNLPGRELPLHFSMDYNSRFFEARTFTTSGGLQYASYDFLGWRKDSGLGGLLSATQTCTSLPGENYSIAVDVYWIEWNGDQTSFSNADCYIAII